MKTHHLWLTCATPLAFIAFGVASASERVMDNAPVVRITVDGPPVAVTSWLVAGPFPSPALPDWMPGQPERAGYDTDWLAPIGGERNSRPRANTDVALRGQAPLRFFAHEWPRGYADLNDVFHVPSEVCAYLYTEIESPVAQTIYLHFGSNASGKAWVGDKLVIAHPDDRVAARSQNVARVNLSSGRTRLLLKIDHDGGGWGAFAEIYGRSAHQAFVAQQFPRHLFLAADKYMPNTGESVEVKITNWIPPDDPISVRWTADAGGVDVPVTGEGSSARLIVPRGPAQTVKIRAVADHPRGGIVAGECTILAGGTAAGEHALSEYAAMDTGRLVGVQRDAYALALYAVERATRDLGTSDIAPRVAKAGKEIAALQFALNNLTARTDPYRSRTGLFEGAYLSEADGTAQPFTLIVPYSYSAQGTYALFVNLHGASFTHELPGDWSPSAADSAHEEDTIILSVMGRGRYSGYRGLGEDDVLSAIRWVAEHYRIDPNRVYLRGGSMGGMGTWRLASLYPDRFAGAWVDCGGPTIETAPNLSNLPMFVNHGDADRSVPVAGARLGTGLMRTAGCPVVYSEFPGVDHGVGVAVSPGGYLTRLSALRRDTAPAAVHVTAAHPRYGRDYWVGIQRWIDPHAKATLDARVLPGNVVAVNTVNVARAQLNPPATLLAAGDMAWFINGTRLSSTRAPGDAYDIVITGDTPSVLPRTDAPEPTVRLYEPGSSMNLWAGEPLVIVYGTTSPDLMLRDSIRTLANEVSRWSAPERQMEFGRIPMLPDTAVTDEEMAARNLILLGGPGENTITKRLMPQMPIREKADTLWIDGERPVSLRDRGYGFVYPNPEHARRLVLIYASHVSRFYTGCRGALLSSRVVDLESAAPDLVVEEVGSAHPADDPSWNRLVRQRWFTHDWRFVETPKEVIGRIPANARDEAEFYAELYRRVAEAPFAIVERADEGAPCSWIAGEVGWEHHPVTAPEVVMFEATGRELLDLADGGWWMVTPRPVPSQIDTAATYRVGGTMETVLHAPNSKRMNARNVRVISDSALIDAACRDVWDVGKPRRR